LNTPRREESMLHTAARRSPRKMIEEHVGVKRTVLHPIRRRGYDLVQHAHDLLHVIVAGFRIHDDTVMSAAVVKIRLGKGPDLNRRVDQPVIAHYSKAAGII